MAAHTSKFPALCFRAFMPFPRLNDDVGGTFCSKMQSRTVDSPLDPNLDSSHKCVVPMGKISHVSIVQAFSWPQTATMKICCFYTVSQEDVKDVVQFHSN